MPSQEEVEKHNLTHLPYRSWCKHCVMGKSKGQHHCKSSKKRSVPVVSIDYMFMSDNQGEGEEKGMTIIVQKDRTFGIITSTVVPQKGVCSYPVDRVSKGLQLLGHKRLIFKSDGEPALVALKRR